MKLRLTFHLLAQVLAQGAVYLLLKDHSPEAIYAALVAVVGVLVAFFDQTYSKTPQ